MESLNKIYEQEELFYWCNCCGDINMPGECGHFVTHAPEELPPQYLALYEKCQMEGNGCHRYVVTFRGRPGMLLGALHDECYYSDILNLSENPTTPGEVMEHACVMKMAALLIMRHCEALSAEPQLEHCIPIFGENTDPDGHELCLFIPADIAKNNIDQIQKVFLNHCWTKGDTETLRNTVQQLGIVAPDTKQHNPATMRKLIMGEDVEIESFHGKMRFMVYGAFVNVPQNAEELLSGRRMRLTRYTDGSAIIEMQQLVHISATDDELEEMQDTLLTKMEEALGLPVGEYLTSSGWNAGHANTEWDNLLSDAERMTINPPYVQ